MNNGVSIQLLYPTPDLDGGYHDFDEIATIIGPCFGTIGKQDGYLQVREITYLVLFDNGEIGNLFRWEFKTAEEEPVTSRVRSRPGRRR